MQGNHTVRWCKVTVRNLIYERKRAEKMGIDPSSVVPGMRRPADPAAPLVYWQPGPAQEQAQMTKKERKRKRQQRKRERKETLRMATQLAVAAAAEAGVAVDDPTRQSAAPAAGLRERRVLSKMDPEKVLQGMQRMRQLLSDLAAQRARSQALERLPPHGAALQVQDAPASATLEHLAGSNAATEAIDSDDGVSEADNDDDADDNAESLDAQSGSDDDMEMQASEHV
eukprot:m51a1_g13343 hypothetical protein (227) ;mRNA; f:209-889